MVEAGVGAGAGSLAIHREGLERPYLNGAAGCGPLLSDLVRRVEALASAVELMERRIVPGQVAQTGRAEESGRITAGELLVDHDARRASVSGRALQLSPAEYRVLYELAKTPGKVVLTSELMRRTRGSFSPDKSYLKVYVGRLRSKITRARGETACDVETVRGVGYRLVVRSAPDVALAPGRAA